MLALFEIDGDQLEGDLLLMQDDSDTPGTGRLRVAVESQDHCSCCFLGEVARRE